ncbi:hypothetical protein [Natronorarus salvus]|uniref:hypothetical protein n=1 Tax=Natronorarus salvus TaxID=3117733 RepID=UPI002F26CD4E
MSFETYTLSVREAETEEGISVDLTTEDGAIERSAWIDYDDHGLTTGEGERPAERTSRFETDARRTDLQIVHDGGAFDVQVRGDSGVLDRVRVDADEWNLTLVE